jgi:seryl-tRNA synthetase
MAVNTPVKKPLNASKKPVKTATITLDDLRKSQNEAWKAIREDRNYLKEFSERQEKANQELRDALRESKKALDKSMGELTNKLGSIVENIMVPDLPKKFKALGYSIDRIATYKYTKQGVYAQIDALLENGTMAIAVEVKTTLRKEDIDDHLLRMDKVRQHADKNGDTRQFLGAMAATIADKTLITYALKQGLFIIQPSSENIKVTKPPKERVW